MLGVCGRYGVVSVEKKEGMVHMLGKLKRYLDKKKLNINMRKIKVMKFKKGGGRMKEIKWRWKGKRIEEVKKFTYLGYKLEKRGRRM